MFMKNDNDPMDLEKIKKMKMLITKLDLIFKEFENNNEGEITKDKFDNLYYECLEIGYQIFEDEFFLLDISHMIAEDNPEFYLELSKIEKRYKKELIEKIKKEGKEISFEVEEEVDPEFLA